MSRIKRSDFTDEEISQAAYYCTKNADGRSLPIMVADYLTQFGRGAVSRQIAAYWLRDLGLMEEKLPGTPRGKYAPKKVEEPKEDGPRVLLLDIETSPIEAYVWSLWKQNVGLNQIKAEWNILSYCAKWLGEETIYYDDARESNGADDSHLVQQLWALLDAADIVIAQNGKRFDVPKINARFVLSGMLPPSPYKIIDTLLMAKQQFGFTSKRLEWMTDKLCVHHKKNKHAKFPGFDLWSECLKGNPEAWDEMREYNIPDVLSMEELYLILRPWYIGHPNVAIYFNDEDVQYRCPKCGSHHVEQKGFSYTQSGQYERMHCLPEKGGCGGWSRGRYTLNTKEVRRVQLSN